MCERYVVLASLHLLILSVDHTKKTFVYEVKHKNPFVSVYLRSYSRFPKYLLARSSSMCMAKRVLTPRCPAKSKAQDGAKIS